MKNSMLNNQNASWVPLRPLYKKGKKFTLYCIPAAGVQAKAYTSLADACEEKVSLIALEARGFDQDTLPHQNLSELVCDYVNVLLDQKPCGKVYLAGHSFGGSVAFEMARQLNSEGIAVHLIILDSNLRPYNKDNALKEIQRCQCLLKNSADPNSKNAMAVYLSQLMIYKDYSPSGLYTGAIHILYAKDGIVQNIGLSGLIWDSK